MQLHQHNSTKSARQKPAERCRGPLEHSRYSSNRTRKDSFRITESLEPTFYMDQLDRSSLNHLNQVPNVACNLRLRLLGAVRKSNTLVRLADMEPMFQILGQMPRMPKSCQDHCGKIRPAWLSFGSEERKPKLDYAFDMTLIHPSRGAAAFWRNWGLNRLFCNKPLRPPRLMLSCWPPSMHVKVLNIELNKHLMNIHVIHWL